MSLAIFGDKKKSPYSRIYVKLATQPTAIAKIFICAW